MHTDQPPWCGDHEGIAEPTPSVVFDLGAVPAATPGAWAARVDAINAEALRCFVIDWNDDPNFVVLDWQHPGYTFDAEAHAAAKELAEWRVPIYPNGDYYIFSRDDFTEGTFGHPWDARCVCSGNGWSKDSAGLCRPGFRDFASTVNRSIVRKSVSGVQYGTGETSPTALAPFRQVRALGTQRRVLAVPGVDDSRVGVPSEQLVFHIVEQGSELLGVGGLAYAAGEE